MAWLLDVDTVENWAYSENVFTPEECEKIIRIGKAKIPKKASVLNHDLEKSIVNNIRKSKVSWLNEKDEIDWLYQRLTNTVNTLNKQFFGFDLYGFCEDIQFTEYTTPGGHYKEHTDKIWNGPIRKLSIVVQLTDPKKYKGGELEINTGSSSIANKGQGTIILFPSYVMHKVTPLTKGTRHSLVAWIAGKNFK